jgi:hypothetical protein
VKVRPESEAALRSVRPRLDELFGGEPGIAAGQ